MDREQQIICHYYASLHKPIRKPLHRIISAYSLGFSTCSNKLLLYLLT